MVYTDLSLTQTHIHAHMHACTPHCVTYNFILLELRRSRLGDHIYVTVFANWAHFRANQIVIFTYIYNMHQNIIVKITCMITIIGVISKGWGNLASQTTFVKVHGLFM